jgi:hypothetical protein
MRLPAPTLPALTGRQPGKRRSGWVPGLFRIRMGQDLHQPGLPCAPLLARSRPHHLCSCPVPALFCASLQVLHRLEERRRGEEFEREVALLKHMRNRNIVQVSAWGCGGMAWRGWLVGWFAGAQRPAYTHRQAAEALPALAAAEAVAGRLGSHAARLPASLMPAPPPLCPPSLCPAVHRCVPGWAHPHAGD